jgi:hypothetical protein
MSTSLKPTPYGKRKRRFPEQELLERIRKYEALLRQNSIKFEPLHKHSAQVEEDRDEVDSEQAGSWKQISLTLNEYMRLSSAPY